MGSNQDVTNLTTLFHTRKDLEDAEKKVGTIDFSKEEKLALAKLVGTPVWDILKTVYAKQRYVQIALANVNAANSEAELLFYKGKAMESNHLIKEIESVVHKFNVEEKNKSNKAPTS